MFQKILPKIKILLSQKWINAALLLLSTKMTIKLKLKIYYLILPNLRNLKLMRISNLMFYSTARRNSKISLNLYIKKSVSLKKNMIAFTQRDQDQEYLTAVLRYIINLSLITVPPFGPFYLLLANQHII